MAANFSDQTEGNYVSSTAIRRTPLTIAVEGNIGSGKSTFLAYCESRCNVAVFPEPIAQWRNVRGENLLARFYENPGKWAMTFQLHVYMTLLQIYRRDTWKELKFVERSLLSSRYCFVEKMRRSGVLEPAMAQVLNDWYDQNTQDHRALPHVIVHFSILADFTGYIRGRARNEEVSVDLAYLNELHDLHENLVARVQAMNYADESDMQVYIIDADLPMAQMHIQYDACLKYLNDLHKY